uniref:Uncharacterized protein n=1 Tax=Panagrolaimus superbus TaxID=310955 RepID=A0A914Y3N1_9BILA
MDVTLLNTLVRPEHQQIWKEISETAMKDGVEPEAIKKLSPYVYAAMEKLRKKTSRPPSGAAPKRKQGDEKSKFEPQPKKKPLNTTADPPKPTKRR